MLIVNGMDEQSLFPGMGKDFSQNHWFGWLSD
jgi:hypothetical protein